MKESAGPGNRTPRLPQLPRPGAVHEARGGAADGGLIRRSNFHNRYWDPLRKRLVEMGVPYVRFHNLRHTAATMWLWENVHAKIVQEWLGHVYDWVLPLSDGSRIHVHVMPDGSLRAHRDRYDPNAGVWSAVKQVGTRSARAESAQTGPSADLRPSCG